MYIRNKSAPKVEPSGTPALILVQDELFSLRIALCFLFLKKAVKRLNKFPKFALRLSLLIILCCHTSS